MISKDITIAHISHDKRERLKDQIVREISLTMVVNEKELVTLQCSIGKFFLGYIRLKLVHSGFNSYLLTRFSLSSDEKTKKTI